MIFITKIAYSIHLQTQAVINLTHLISSKRKSLKMVNNLALCKGSIDNVNCTCTAPTPASHSTYCAIQRGEMDIPLSGLQKPAPAPHSHKGNHHLFN